MLKTSILLLKKTLHASLLLAVMLIAPWVNAQVVVSQHVIVWGKPVSFPNADSVIKVLSFEDAEYSAGSLCPRWNKTFYADNLTENVQVENCIYLPLTAPEMILIKPSVDEIPGKLAFSVHKTTSRKQQGLSVGILPFVKNEASGLIEKLSSFELHISSGDNQNATMGRNYASNSVLSQGNWYKLAVTKTGIYRLEYNDLVAMGINPADVDPAKIGIFGKGGNMLPELNSVQRPDDLPENAIEVTGAADGKFDQGDQILFFAQGPVIWSYNGTQKLWEHSMHLYSDTISYFLTSDRGTGKRIPAIESTTAAATDIVDSYDYYTYYEENNFNLIKSGRQWFGQIFDVVNFHEYAFDLPVLAAGGNVGVKSVTAAKSVIPSSFTFNVGSQSWTALHPTISTYPNSPVATGITVYQKLQSVTLPFKLQVTYNKTSSSGAGYLDLFDITARCKLNFNQGQLAFRDGRSWGTGKVAQYTLAVASGKATVWEVSDPVSVKKINASQTGNDLAFRLASDSLHEFIAFDNNEFLKPRFVQKITNQNLHANTGADLVIIAPPIFMPQAQKLATFHASSSDMDIMLLDPTTIYNEFSSGTPDVTAIRDFMKMLYDKGTTIPRYLLLFGDGSYDYKNKLESNTNFVPSWQTWESFDPIHSIVCDDFFGMLDNNEGGSYADVIDLGIGRFPVKTMKEAEEAVDKIIHYSTRASQVMGDWRNVITFVADDEDLNEHVENSEWMADRIEEDYPVYNIDKIYLDSYLQVAATAGNRYPEVNKAITQRVENGSLILNYIGHGGETGLAHEEVLTTSDINNWSNYNNLPVFVTATCEFSRFDDPGRTSAGEMVFLNPKGGGIALFTTTRPTYGTPNFDLNKKFYEYALSKPSGKRLAMGDIIMNSKRDKGATENGRKYVLLGDPALNIAFPACKVVTTSVNGHAPGLLADTLKAYQQVNIQGIIADENGSILNDFNGVVFPSVFDKAVAMRTLANDGGAVFTFSLRKNLLYKGKVIVTNGAFSFSFIVPKDIAYRFDTGKISYYATDSLRDAAGDYENLIIGGSSDGSATDNTGPSVNLYINDLRFRDGGITDQNPRLLAIVSDESGINTIGNGIGHDITAILDRNTEEPYILNDFYESDINTFRSGYIWFPFSLLPVGEHSVTVKVWDIFNNSSESTIHFKVNASGEFIITNSYAYPNPFSAFTDIVFEHNQKDVEFELQAEIYSLTGKLITSIGQTAAQTGSVSTPVRWDGQDGNGNCVPSGMYFYTLTARTSNGLSARTSGKLIYRKN